MTHFSELDIGDVFKTNLMYFQKIKPKERTGNNDRRIRVNARFLSDDHYENNNTENYVSSGSVWINSDRAVEKVSPDLRAVRNEKTSVK